MRQAAQTDDLVTRRILIAGGHARIRGGLEAFIARARECLGIDAHVFTETPGRRGWMRFAAALKDFSARLADHDLVWLHYGSLFDLAFLVVAKAAGKNVAVTPHLGAHWRSMRNPVLRTIANRVLSLADRVFTLSPSQAAALRFPECLRRRTIVMGTFVPKQSLTATPAPRKMGGPLKLVHAARLSADKGSFAFLDVCEALRARGTAFEATIVGEGAPETRTALAAAISQRNLPVTLLGALPQAAFLEFLASQDVLVNLSLQDAYPLTAIEALLSGVVPVVTALDGTRDLAADAPVMVLVEGQDAAAAAACIAAIDFAAVPASAAALRRQCDWSVLAHRHARAFAELSATRTLGLSPQPLRATTP